MRGNGQHLYPIDEEPPTQFRPTPSAIAGWVKIAVIVVSAVGAIVVATVQLESWLDKRVREHLAPVSQRLDRLDDSVTRLGDKIDRVLER